MRLYRRGDAGESVRDIQDRLHALGFDFGAAEPGVFGANTERTVREFQQKRGLGVDGIVGPDTWHDLVAAGYRLGDRMLYHRIPNMRGDDVTDLQHRLNSLGFDAAKVDGIFGPSTLNALLDFQANRRLAEDGIAGYGVTTELALMARATQKHGRELVRERQWLRTLPNHITGQHIYVDAFCRDPDEGNAAWSAATTFARTIKGLGAHPTLSRSIDSRPPERVRALRANRTGVDIVVSFAMPREKEAVFFYATSRSSSAAGALLASEVAICLGTVPEGRSIPMLRDTRAPTIVIAVSPMDADLGHKAVQGVSNLYMRERET